MTLYEISNEISQILDNEELSDEQFEHLSNLEMAKQDKIINIAKVLLSLDSDLAIIDTEIKRLQERKKAIDNKRERLKNYCLSNMDDEDKIKNPIINISVRKTEIVAINDLESIPDKFVEIKTVRQPDKLAIKNAIKSGQSVSGAEIQVNRHLSLK